MPYSIARDESEEDNTYISYNKVIGTSLDEKLYLAFEVLDYALLSAPGAPLKRALTDAGIGKDIMGSYDNGIYQPIFSVIAKNANVEQKEAFVKVIEDTLKDIVENGMDKKALEAGINYNEFRYREADFGGYPKGLMYGLQIMDSWLYDDEKPFIHIEALDTFEFLKAQVGTGYYEELIRKYLLENTHGAIVLIKPEKGRTARMDKELQEKLQAYKESLTEEERKELVERSNTLEAYQSAPDAVENLEKIPVLSREDISKEIEPIINEECQVWKKQIFRMSESCREYLESLIPRIISTENSLMRSTCIPAVLEHHWNCIQTFPKCRKKNSKQHLKSKERHYIRSCQSYSG